jgi:alginate O-acetyltransferase complex protein AlgI
MLCYTFQLYYDFSGYCDMAIGLGWMFNVDLPLNFDLPYKSKSIREFWRRWHITLSSFFREYVYFPLGGSRKGKFRKELNTFIVFMLSGLWHGAAWNFVIWGCFHGLMLVTEDIFAGPLQKMEENRVLSTVKWFFTFILINFSWVLFRVNSLSDLPVFFEKLFSFRSEGKLLDVVYKIDNALLYVPDTIAKKLGGESLHNALYIGFTALCLLAAALPGLGKSAYERAGSLKYKRSTMIVLALLFFFSVLSLSKVIVFLYSNF